MVRDELISEISMRRDIPMEEVEEVLEEQDMILEEECRCKKKRKCRCFVATLIIFVAGMVVAMLFLDKKEKISLSDIEDMVKSNVKKYVDKVRG
ncbi:MAG: hypothetical protein ACI39Q_02150 [Wujia sp.]